MMDSSSKKIAIAAALITTTVIAIRSNASYIYDIAIYKMTKLWYEVTINRLESSSYLLDIGVGNATSLLGNIDTIRTKGINIKVS